MLVIPEEFNKIIEINKKYELYDGSDYIRLAPDELWDEYLVWFKTLSKKKVIELTKIQSPNHYELIKAGIVEV